MLCYVVLSLNDGRVIAKWLTKLQYNLYTHAHICTARTHARTHTYIYTRVHAHTHTSAHARTPPPPHTHTQWTAIHVTYDYA